jgi:hypothetical protein
MEDTSIQDCSMKRIILIVMSVVAVALIIAFAKEIWFWIEVHTGTVNEPGPYYGFWSGFGSDIGEGAIVIGLIGLFRKANCHIPRCPLLSHHEYEMDGVKYKLCRKHMPGLDHKNRPTHEHFLRHHERNKDVTD